MPWNHINLIGVPGTSLAYANTGFTVGSLPGRYNGMESVLRFCSSKKDRGHVKDAEENFVGMHQHIENLRREYSRVDAYIPCEYRIVPPEERPHVQARIPGDNIATEHKTILNRENSDPVLEEWLQVLNLKLDAIIRLMNLRQEGYLGLPYKAVNISGGGMSFSVPEKIPLGEILEIKITLTFQQPIVLIIYGEAVKSDLVNDGHFVAVHYIHMDDSIRDMIVRFVFEREREIIRETRR